MSKGPGEYSEIYRAGSLAEAYALCSALEREGVAARIDNEALQDAVGGIVPGWPTLPRVLVRTFDEAAGRAILEAFLQRADHPADEKEPPLRCLACGAPIGEGDTCPACNWSYASAADAADSPGVEPMLFRSRSAVHELESAHTAAAELPEPSPEESAVRPSLGRRAIWGEVGAVLAVGVVPSIISSLVSFGEPPRALPPYWLEALDRTLLHGCQTFVVLYLIHRSGEPWARFGLVRPGVWDALLGVGLFLAAETVWLLCCGPLPWDPDPTARNLFPRPQQPVDYPLMLLWHGASGFAQELITRAYLITRFELLLRSRLAAVLAAGVLFAAYHGYQSTAAVAESMALAVLYGAAFLLIRRVWPLAIGHALCNILVDLRG
jgi:hypothetical protein